MFARVFVVFCLPLLLSLPANAQSGNRFDFKLLYLAAQLANDAYDKRSKILREYAGQQVWVNTPGDTNVQYILITDDRNKRQIIAVRGTVDNRNWQLDKDIRGVRDGKAGVLLHRGFRQAAETIYADVKPRLKQNYTIYMTGHSLGGAVAAILGMYVLDDNFRVGKIVTFGQPKFTNLAGARAYRDLPLLRLVYQNDTVSLLPRRTAQTKQKFFHIGPVLNLLPGPYYIYATKEQSIRFDSLPFGRFLMQVSIPDHKMKWYLQSLKDKVAGAKRVPLKQRNRYIVRNKYGSGVDTVKPKRKTNFNNPHP